jgi:hypothetical protein
MPYLNVIKKTNFILSYMYTDDSIHVSVPFLVNQNKSYDVILQEINLHQTASIIF